MSKASWHAFGSREAAFAAAPDPRFAWLDGDAGHVLDRLEKDVLEGSGGISLLAGRNGSGKTLLAQCLLERLAHHDVRVARVLHSQVTPVELLQSVCDRLRVPMDGVDRDSGRDMINALSTFLMDIYAQGQRVLLVVDEAQNLSDESLEQLRLLTNLQTPAHQLMHILMLSTPTLRERLRSTTLKPLAQRITGWHELSALSAEACETYVGHRLEAAGVTQMPFTRLALRDLYRFSHGVPRLVNLLAERAMEMAVAADSPRVGERIMQQAARDVLPGHLAYWLLRYRWWWLALAAVLLLLGGFAWWGNSVSDVPPVKSLVGEGVSLQQQVQHLGRDLPAPRESRLQSWSEMLARWQVGSDKVGVDEASQCEAVVFPGFNCVSGTGSLDQLARFDRPMILDLESPDGIHQVLLLGVGDTRVHLLVDSHRVEVSRKALTNLWHGHFYAPFRLPTDLPAVMKIGSTGPGVVWLEAQLRQAGMPAAGGHASDAVFDAAMRRRIRELQRRFGIPDDGIVGPETLFALTSLDAAGPHLAHGVP